MAVTSNHHLTFLHVNFLQDIFYRREPPYLAGRSQKKFKCNPHKKLKVKVSNLVWSIPRIELGEARL